MATEAKVRVMVDVTQAKAEMDQINQRMEKSRSLGSDLAGTVRTIATRAAGGVAAVAGAADLAAGGGLISSMWDTASAVIGREARNIFSNIKGLGPEQLIESAGFGAARRQAVDAVGQLLGAGGDVSPQEIDRLVKDFTSLFLPGALNRQRVMARGMEGTSAGSVAPDYYEKLSPVEKGLYDFGEALRNATDSLLRWGSGG